MLIIFTGLSIVLQAQVKLSGKIVNTKNEPLAGASIKIIGSPGGTTSDVEGRYALNLLPGRKYELEISAIGYSSKLINEVEVGASMDNELNIVLEIAAKNIEGVTVRATSRRQVSILSFRSVVYPVNWVFSFLTIS